LEQRELLGERQLVIEEENKSGYVDADDPQYMDERIDLITLQLDTLNQQIQHVNNERDDMEDEDNWMDIELQMDDSSSLAAYETALSLIRSLEPEEARLVSESLMEDLISLKTKHQTNIMLTKHLNYMVYSLQTALVQMRRAGKVSSVFNENEEVCIIDYDQNNDIIIQTSSPDTKSEFLKPPRPINTSVLSPLDTVFMTVLTSPVDIKCGLVLLK
jgi:hypothetical protein